MQYLITSTCDRKECQHIIQEANDIAAWNHYSELLVRQPSHPCYKDYSNWRLERMPVESKLIAENGTICL